ncbi:MAG: hypothetical protein M0D57_21220 [Sphingobacteriales bacterium JAD_PAG50586_3]|nr:MAG: hypothetical protein M0D57_21220 [Sphingobacteriales bacterium JAD_PAG50586_3]
MLKDLLNLHAEILRKRIVDEMAARNKNATGKTAAGLQIEVTNDGFKLIDNNGNFQFIEYGTAPHKNKKPGYGFAAAIEQWIKAKGIPLQGNTHSVAYAIATHLKRKGSKQYQSKTPAGIIKAALNKEYMDKLVSSVAASIMNY